MSSQAERWERRETAFFEAAPYLLLAVSTVMALLPVWDLDVRVPAVLGLSLATAAWIAWFVTLHPGWRRRRPLMALYYTGLTALAAGLVLLAPWYGIFAFTGYVHAAVCLTGRWRYAGVAATSAITAVTYVGGIEAVRPDGWGQWAVVAVVAIVLSSLFFHLADVSDRRGDEQKRVNAELEAALAENAGLHAQLLVQAREAGVHDERQRMAREIHDTLAQGLAGIVTQLQAAEQTLAVPATARRHVTTAMELARESLTEARRTVHAVQPEVLAGARLPDAIGDVVRRWSEVNGIDAVLTTTGDARPMHAEVEVTLLRAAQEALANVAKHARAGRVGLTLSYMEDLVTLDVRDDGVGFEPGAARTGDAAGGGFGLAGMRQRVQRLAGRLDVESEPGGGTAVSASVPAIPAGDAR
ncbi:sensor histidine kinase [Jiangella alba]|uniref:Oxygen sensor histidine kinase NreB n=1 Tax=Jiangella alba TaxID=561176 RepID=A0A1H5LLL5_9ACTN|nr:sensor histidine kinase [Jiangella alba]SEE77963.1 Signal transduction histidine kinase [Jiangella alba]